MRYREVDGIEHFPEAFSLRSKGFSIFLPFFRHGSCQKKRNKTKRSFRDLVRRDPKI